MKYHIIFGDSESRFFDVEKFNIVWERIGKSGELMAIVREKEKNQAIGVYSKVFCWEVVTD